MIFAKPPSEPVENSTPTSSPETNQFATMPPKSSTILCTLFAPSRFLRPSIRYFSVAPAPRVDPPRASSRLSDWGGRVEDSRNKFMEKDFEDRLKALRDHQPRIDLPGDDREPQKPGATGPNGEEDKRVELIEIIQTQHRFGQGDAYAPHDLSFQEQRKRRARKTPSFDAMDLLGINPIKEYKNFSMMSEYMTEMGRIKHSRDTGLRPVNQRRMAKAIRRAIGLGLMPAVHRHPEVMGMARPDKKYIARTW